MATDSCVRFGKRIRQLRTEHEIGPGFIADLERGKKEPCLRSIEILAIAFEMTVP